MGYKMLVSLTCSFSPPHPESPSRPQPVSGLHFSQPQTKHPPTPYHLHSLPWTQAAQASVGPILSKHSLSHMWQPHGYVLGLGASYTPQDPPSVPRAVNNQRWVSPRVLNLPPTKFPIRPLPWLPPSPTTRAVNLTGSDDASLSLSHQTLRIPESTHVIRVLQSQEGF